MEEVRQLLNRVKPWVLIACVLGVILIGYFAYQGFRYWRAWSDESSLAKEISVLDGKLEAVSPLGDLDERLEDHRRRLQTDNPKLKAGQLRFLAQKRLLDESKEALKQQLEAEEKLVEEGNLRLEEVNGLFQYPSTDDLLKIVADTAQKTGLNLISISTGELQPETVGPMFYQVRRVGLNLGGDPAEFVNFLALLQEMVPVTSATGVRFTLEDDPKVEVTLLFFLSPVPVPTPTPVPAPTKVPYPTPSPGLRETSTPDGSAGSLPRQGLLVHRAPP